MNVMTQLTRFVAHDVINKNTTDVLRADWLYAVQLGQLSSVELCRYKRALSLHNDLPSSCVVVGKHVLWA